MTHPTLEQEITRKATETLAETIEGYEAGLYTPNVALERLNAIWGCCAGLADQDVMSMVSDTINELQKKAQVDAFEVFIRDHDVIGVVQFPTSQSTALRVFSGGRFLRIGSTDDTLPEILSKRQKFIQKLQKVGTRL